jgi:hypothetical protein
LSFMVAGARFELATFGFMSCLTSPPGLMIARTSRRIVSSAGES